MAIEPRTLLYINLWGQGKRNLGLMGPLFCRPLIMGKSKVRKPYWKELRKEPANLNQKGGPFKSKNKLIDELELEEWEEEMRQLEEDEDGV